MDAPSHANESLHYSHSMASLATSLTSSSQQQPEAPRENDETDKQCSLPSCDYEFSEAEESPAGNDGLTDYDIKLKDDGQKSEAGTMTLLPPPPSWFQFEDDKQKCLPVNASQKSAKTDSTRVSRTALAASDAPTLSTNRPKQNAVPTDSGCKEEVLPSIARQLESSEEFLTYKLGSTPSSLEVPMLPEFNSPEAQMFDLPVTFHTNHDTESDSLSITSAIDTIISQTLSFTTTTLSQTIPTLLHECSSSAIQNALHKLKTEYARLGPRKYLRASDLGSVGGYFRPDIISSSDINESIRIESSVALGKGKDNHFDWMWMDGREVRFTNLPWVERQLVHEWRTYEWTTCEDSGDGICVDLHDDPSPDDAHASTSCNILAHKQQHEVTMIALDDAEDVKSEDDDDEEFDQADVGEYERARTLAPRPLPRPQWEHASSCYICQRTFGPTLHRHHCRRCGHSYCNAHSIYFHQLPHLGYDRDVRERVCRGCKVVLDSRDMEERVVVSHLVMLCFTISAQSF
jgi:hypothetical protein